MTTMRIVWLQVWKTVLKHLLGFVLAEYILSLSAEVNEHQPLQKKNIFMKK